MEESTATPQQGMPPEIAKLIKLFGDKLTRDSRASIYANNSRFEASVWDLKIFLGQLDQDANDVDWHTVVTMPWLQVKLLTYYLRLNIAFREKAHGPLEIPTTLKPAPPEAPTEEQMKNDPSLKDLFDVYSAIYTETFG